MKKRAGRELYEAFQRKPKGELSRAWWLQRTGQKEENASPAGSAKRDQTTPPGRVTLTFSREALVFVCVVLVGMMISMFVLGRMTTISEQRAQRNIAPETLTAELSRNDAAPAADLRGTTLSVGIAKRYYSLRLLENLSYDRAEQIVQDLKQAGHDAFLMKEQTTYTLYTGRFPNWKSADAQAYKETVQKLVYSNRNLFLTCAWREITNP